MPNFNEIFNEARALVANNRGDAYDVTRQKYINLLHNITGRNIIAYYSGFLTQPAVRETNITDMDKNGFMTVINKMDRSIGLDLILHTPGGDLAATESLVEYLHMMFGKDIRAIIPQISMSAGTMIACACKSIVMGKQSSLGPIDPQLNGLPASGVLEEFERAVEEVGKNPKCMPVWRVILEKYHPTFLGSCEKAIDWSRDLAQKWLSNNMLSERTDCSKAAAAIVDYLSDHSKTKAHARHIGITECERIGLRIEKLEDDNDFQDAVLSVHHAFMLSFLNSQAVKIIENHSDTRIIFNANRPNPPTQMSPVRKQTQNLEPKEE
ncbi:MAG: serine protease [Oscillospiraceae bacterium]|nr:serine protease [Oscillospiraceae bacterium]